MAQKNYFTYNIIDSIYFDQPTGDELTELYGIENSFKRRNQSEYDTKSQADKDIYDAQEKRFIQGVINRYIIDDYGGKKIDGVDDIVMNGSYIGIDTEHRDQYVGLQTGEDLTYVYFKPNRENGIELSDMISNINGTHNYKLMSAKDIDFDNVILPNSAITREFNWGGFDRNRRWGDKPIHINNTFELLNVIDYLLCACDNLWNELYKIKYSVNEGVELWFTKDVSDKVLIHSSNQLVVQDFQINSSRTERTKMVTYLDPFKYYTSLNNNVENNFGIVTNFYKIEEDLSNLTFDRKIIDTTGKNIILMQILPQGKIIDDYVSTLSQNINGTLQQIYTYKIGDELKIYPGSRIDTFINERNIKTLANDIIDFKDKKLKSETYFKSNSSDNIYSKLYVEFLNSNTLGLSNNSEDYKNPYLLYYLNDSGKKIIIAYSYQDSELSLVSEIKSKIEEGINKHGYTTYEFYNYENNALDDQVLTGTANGQTVYSPKFYVLTDEFFSTLEVATPNSKKFAASSKSIMIYYYKNNNKLNCEITRINKNDEKVEIHSEDDPIQATAYSYNYFRYNIPDNQDITFKFDATYIALDSTSDGNPLGLKLDDEYKDIMLYHPENITTDGDANKYYELKTVETSGLYNRVFEQFDKDTFSNNKNNYTSTDSKSGLYKHTWMKYDNPYRLHVTIDYDEFVNQSISPTEIANEINQIKTHNELVLTSYNTYTFNHTLTGEVEEVKLNLRFQIDETSKVKATECVIPLNVNKIYYPTINYFSYQAVKLENSNYSNIKYSYNFNREFITLSDIYEKAFRKYTNLNKVPNLCELMTGNDVASLDDLQSERSTYDNVFNNTYFEFTYNPKLNFINLIGGWYTEQYIPKNGRGFAIAQMKFNNSSNVVVLKSNNQNSSEYGNHLYFFNINGLSKKYRLHGNSNTVPDNINTATDDQLKTTIIPEFDLISVASEKAHQTINEQLKIKLIDDAQLTYICIDKEQESTKYIWEENNNDFNSGYNIVNKDYIIKTLPLDIYKTTYLVKCKQDYGTNPSTFTYYLPITYAYINSSTFYPPENTKPNGIVHDINDDVERTKYKDYMDCWNDLDNYHPITMSLKLFDNTAYSNPYYYESNEAVMKFNILRAESQRNVMKIEGIDAKYLYVAMNSNYYLSDFITVSPSSEIADVSSYYPSGSYFYFDENYHTYIVNEIYSNTKNPKLGNNHNNHYNNSSVNTNNDNEGIFNNLLLPETESSLSPLIPYPIFHKQIERNDDVIEFSPTLYDYDIYRLADINKLNIQQIICNKYKYNLTQPEDLSNNIKGIYTNTTYYTIQFGGDTTSNDEYLTNFGDNNSFNMLYYHIEHGACKGSKNYDGATSLTSRTDTFICPIIRKKKTEYNTSQGHTQMPELYPTREYKEEEYEFFEFRYDDVYEVKKEEDNTWSITSIAPGGSLSCKEAYDAQLKLFLKNDDEDFISNLTIYTVYYEN